MNCPSDLSQAKRALLAVAACEWDGPRGRSHHFMRFAASSGWQVVYLEPPATLLGPFADRRMLARWRRWRAGLRSVGDDLHVLAPPPVLPFANRVRAVNRLNQAMIGRTVNRALFRLGNPPVDVYSFLPNAVDLLTRLRFDRSIYDCVDDQVRRRQTIARASSWQGRWQVVLDRIRAAEPRRAPP